MKKLSARIRASKAKFARQARLTQAFIQSKKDKAKAHTTFRIR